MDWNKLKFTKKEEDLMEFLFTHPTTSFNGKELAQKLRVSQTTIAKRARRLSKLGLLTLDKKILLSIKLNREDKDIFVLKRIYNLKRLYASGVVKALSADIPGITLILFGSYSYGEDTEDSDIDLALVGEKEKLLDITQFEKILGKKLSLHFYDSFASINKHLRNSIINGIVLNGAIKL